MALSDPRSVFGIHSVTPYSRTTGEFYGELRVLGSSSLSLSGELIKLNGGSQKFPWHIEPGLQTAELSLVIREYPDFVFELFLGKAPTTNSAETSGNATAIANKNGTSVVNATTGITSTATVSTAADLKFGKYVVKAVSATTVDVFFSSDADITRGSDGTMQNNALKITASALTITSSGTTAIPNFGITLNGGSGAIAFTTGHTATFSVRPINSASTLVTIGANTDSNPEFGCIVMAQKRANQEMTEVDLFRCVATGLPLGFEEFSWSEAEVTVEAFYDSTQNGVFSLRHVSPT